jgi:galactoside O-acetyltransferase
MAYFLQFIKKLLEVLFKKKGIVITNGSKINIHKSVKFGEGAFLTAKKGGGITIGRNTSFNHNVMLNADFGGQILIDEDCLIGPGVVFRTANHNYHDRNTLIRLQGHSSADIIVEKDVWIGANAVILPGVTIGRGSVVGAGAVVTRNVESYSVVAGVPAKKIKER